ncbi:PaaI family thioesterase [Breoghania sp. JC706]|uniref:PaaI family thioesterase n=1 Tax=Breoghania sp. JC706 TaxID=3117732 RepID=UPI00300B2791
MNEPSQMRYGVVSHEDVAGMNGLEILQAMLERRFPAPPIMKTLAFNLTEVGEGYSRFVGQPRYDFYNPLGTVHGGWIATLLDSALGCAVHSSLAAGETYTTLEFKVNCTRPVFDTTGELVCEGRLVHRGRRTATAEATLKDDAGRLYAHASETCMILPVPAPAAKT